MILKHRSSGKLVEVLDLYELTSPYEKKLVACLQWDEDMPDPRCFDKKELCFTSGENLPGCWVDEQYAGHDLQFDAAIALNDASMTF